MARPMRGGDDTSHQTGGVLMNAITGILARFRMKQNVMYRRVPRHSLCMQGYSFISVRYSVVNFQVAIERTNVPHPLYLSLFPP